MKKTDVILIRIEPALKRAAKKQAKLEGRSLSNWLLLQVRRGLEKDERS